MITKNIITEIGRIAEPHKQIHVKTITQIVENGKVLSLSYHRHVCAPDHEDLESQAPVVQSVAGVLWTQEIKSNYRAFLVEQETKLKAQQEPEPETEQ